MHGIVCCSLAGRFVLSFDMGGSVPGFVVKKASLERGKAVLAVKRHMLKVRVGTFVCLHRMSIMLSILLPLLPCNLCLSYWCVVTQAAGKK